MVREMSKSLGNFYTMEKALKKFGGELLRFTLLQFHYRSNSDFNPQLLAANSSRLAAAYERIAQVLRRREEHPSGALAEDPWQSEAADQAATTAVADIESKFHKAMDDDFNTPEAIVVLEEAMRTMEAFLKRKKDSGCRSGSCGGPRVRQDPRVLSAVLGLWQQPPAMFFKDLKNRFLAAQDLSEAWILERMKAREQARAEKDYARSDQIRDELLARGIEPRDGTDNSDWMVAKRKPGPALFLRTQATARASQ